MSDTRTACPQCGEQVSNTAPTCFRCGGSLLWDLVVAAPVADPKERFFLAKALVEARPGAAVGELQRALAAAGGRLAAGLAQAFARPGLMGATPRREGLVAVVARHSPAGKPPEGRAHFELQEDGHTICQADASVRDWHRLDEKGEPAPGASRMARWAWRNGVQKDLYVAVVPVPLPGCRPGEGRHELLLEGADPQTSRETLPF